MDFIIRCKSCNNGKSVLGCVEKKLLSIDFFLRQLFFNGGNFGCPTFQDQRQHHFRDREQSQNDANSLWKPNEDPCQTALTLPHRVDHLPVPTHLHLHVHVHVHIRRRCQRPVVRVPERLEVDIERERRQAYQDHRSHEPVPARDLGPVHQSDAYVRDEEAEAQKGLAPHLPGELARIHPPLVVVDPKHGNVEAHESEGRDRQT
ncbi:unnamed protein product [Mortierella alpina]